MYSPSMHSQQQKQTRYVSLKPHHSSSSVKRDAEGRVIHSPVKAYGTMMDLGHGAKGVEESDVTLGVLDKLHKGLLKGRYEFGKGAKVGMNELGKTVNVAVPYGSMPENETGGQKGSSCSSQLNKPIDIFAAIPLTLPISLAASAQLALPAGSGWGNMFFLNPGEWKCDTCSTKNPKEAAECIACTSPLGGEQGADAGEHGQIAAPAAAGSARIYSFDAPKAGANPAPASTGGFTFGAPKAVDLTAPVRATGGFTFGAAKEQDDKPSPVTGGFTFGYLGSL